MLVLIPLIGVFTNKFSYIGSSIFLQLTLFEGKNIRKSFSVFEANCKGISIFPCYDDIHMSIYFVGNFHLYTYLFTVGSEQLSTIWSFKREREILFSKNLTYMTLMTCFFNAYDILQLHRIIEMYASYNCIISNISCLYN